LPNQTRLFSFPKFRVSFRELLRHPPT
jgi:hypothetical protein